MAESNGQDVRVPWFSGLCLEGEVAGQYEIDRSGSQQEGQETMKAGVLELDGLAPITIFVGANNSGKSRLMRELFGNSEAAKCLQVGPDSDEMKSDLRKLLALIQPLEAFQPGDNNGLGEVITAVEKFLVDYRDWKDEAVHGWIWINAMTLLDAINAKIKPFQLGGGTSIDRSYLTFWPNRYQALSQSRFSQRMQNFLSLSRCYVPMLRGMRPPLASVSSDRQGIDASDCYEERSILDYFDELPNWRSLAEVEEDKSSRIQQGQAPVFLVKPRIFTGLSLYHDIQKRLLAPTYEERKSIRDYELFLSVNFFQGREVTLTPALQNQEGKDNDVVHIKIGEGEDRPIYALGDGMQSLIICTFPIITELQRGSLFFLEEPDLCMHPSLQRVFLKVLRESYTEKGHQFFLTTHSNHLLDLLEDDDLVSIFSFSEIADRALAPAVLSQTDGGANSKSSKPQPQFRIRPSDLRDRRTLLELGVRPSATYLANATIWVEGVSDCAYLRAYMEAFVHYLDLQGNAWGKSLAYRLSQYKEDRHYAFVEYSGSNLEHYSFKDKGEDSEQAEAKPNKVTSVTILCARAIVIADGDIGDTGKGDRKESFAAQLGDRFIWLPGKEIENMIPEALMREQVRRDIQKYETTSQGMVDGIFYHDYYRSGIGVGAYLYGLGFFRPKYKGDSSSGTLSSHMKGKWSSNDKGIPWLVQQELKRDNKAERNGDVIGDPSNPGKSQSNDEAEASRALPSYLTQDLIWLCVCLYVHIANCNHDQETEQKLKKFQQFIRDQGKDSKGPTVDANDGMQLCVESDKPAESAAPEWPIQAVERHCLLTAFLDRTSRPEAISTPHPESQAQATCTATGPTAAPAT